MACQPPRCARNKLASDVGLYSSTDLEVWAPWQARARLLRHVPLAALPLDSVTAAVADALAPAPAARETPQAALD